MLSSHSRLSAVIVHSARRWISSKSSKDSKIESIGLGRLGNVKKEFEVNIFERKTGWSQELGDVDDLSSSINIFVKPREEINQEIKQKENLPVGSRCSLSCNSQHRTFPNCEFTTQQWQNHNLPINKNCTITSENNTNALSCSKHSLQKTCNAKNDESDCNNKYAPIRAKEPKAKVHEFGKHIHEVKQPSSLPKRINAINAQLTPSTSLKQATKSLEGLSKRKGERINNLQNESLQEMQQRKETNDECKPHRIIEEKSILLKHESNDKEKNNKDSSSRNNEVNRGDDDSDDNNDDSRFHYYRNLSNSQVSKEEMWRRIRLAKSDTTEKMTRPLEPDDVDYLKIVTDLKEHDLFHYRVGEMAYDDKLTRRDYYGMWALAMSLNKARWSMMQAHAERGMKTTGAGVKLLYWKESIGGIVDKGCMVQGQFSDQHPVLRVFGDAVGRHPKMTKAFIRGFTDARLRVLQQPGNVKQLFEYYDKFYGYFFNSLLQVVEIKDEGAEHLMLHIGRALGLTLHTVMLWKKYARIGFTMLPADLCADHRVNVALLRNIPLASIDLGVRELLHEVMCIVKNEMRSAESIAKDVTPLAWPIVMECTYPNYHLMWLQRQNFNVSALLADYNVENPGLTWYRLKKQWEWKRHQSMEKLVAEAAPLPLIGTS